MRRFVAAAGLLVLLMTIVPNSARADTEVHRFKLCNHLLYKVFAATALRDYSHPGGTIVRGWYAAAPGECAYITIPDDHFYIHVRGRVGNQVRVTIPAPIDGDNFNLAYCFDPDNRFEFRDTATAYCPGVPKENFFDWHFYERGEEWDVN